MATIIENKNKKGELISYKFMTCVGRDSRTGKQVWRTKTVKRPFGLTPKKERTKIEHDAANWEREQKENYNEGFSNQDKDRITFAQFVNSHWWPDHVEDGSHTPSSVAFYGYMKNAILEYFGDRMLLSQIDAETVKRYLKYLNTEAKTRSGKPLSKTTVMHHFSTLRGILEYARRFHYIDYDPCQDLTQKEKPHRDKKKVDYLDSDQAREFIRCLEEESLFWRCLENILITCGLRRGEAVALQWQDISKDGLTLTIRRNVTIDKNSPEKYHIGSTKTGGERVIPISRRVYGLLMERKAEQQEQYGTLLPSAFIFNRPADPYAPINPQEPTRWQRRFVNRHGLKNVSPHDLRHTAATLALEAGADLKAVQELLGHQDAQTTMQFYLGVSQETQRETVEGIDKLIAE